MRKIVLAGMFMLLSVSFYARDIFVYNGTAKVTSVTGIKKITFATDVMNVEQQNGMVVPVKLSDFDNFSFKEKTVTGISSVATDASVTFDGATLKVSNAETLSVYDMGGRELLQIQSGKQTVTVSLAGYASGVYVVKCMVDGKVCTQKIYKK